MENIKNVDNIEAKDILPRAFAEDVTSIKQLYEQKKAELGKTDRQIYKLLSMEPKTLNSILDGTAKRVNFTNAIKLANFLEITLSEIAESYLSTADSKEIEEIQAARNLQYIYENFDITALTKERFFEKHYNAKEMSERIIAFFDLGSLYDYTKEAQISTAFSRTKKKLRTDLMRDFWVISALTQFKRINNPNAYDRKALIELIPKIRPYTMNVRTGFKMVLRALFQVGVTVIFQPKLENTQVRGATMVVNDKPCVVISNLNNKYPTLWFALLHELSHVLFDFTNIRNQTYHISDGIGDLMLTNEEKADKFANDYLLNDSRLTFAKRYINSPIMLESFARQCGIHPSIIYVRYCYTNGNWAFYNKFIPKMDEAIQDINTDPFGHESLLDSVNLIKEFYNI